MKNNKFAIASLIALLLTSCSSSTNFIDLYRKQYNVPESSKITIEKEYGKYLDKENNEYYYAFKISVEDQGCDAQIISYTIENYEFSFPSSCDEPKICYKNYFYKLYDFYGKGYLTDKGLKGIYSYLNS